MSVIDDDRVWSWSQGDPHATASVSGRRLLDALADRAAAMPRSALYLVPLRIFIGLGWLRAGVEKVVDPDWWSGSVLQVFIAEQTATGLVLAPVRPLLTALEGAAVPVAAVIAVVQIVIGVAIMAGWRTTPALFAGIAMNTAFVLAGRTNPNVFYLLVQWALLVGGAGCLFGIDGIRRSSTDTLQLGWSPRRWVAVMVGAVLTAGVLVPFVVERAPARVVDDPALVLITMALLVAGTAALAGLRAWARAPRTTADPASPLSRYGS